MNLSDHHAQITGNLREGEILAGKYRIDKVLGTGGMGVVVAAEHLQLDQKVAIKFLLPEAADNPEAQARFSREARAAVKITSEHVTRVIDVGTLDNGMPYMVMERLLGDDLSAWLERCGVLSLTQAVDFVLQALEAIAEAHGLGIVHRDLKPANLYCIRRPDGSLSIKVLDFGISKVTDTRASDKSSGMTKTATMMGSPFYMSPEQLRSSRDVDQRTDIWSLGIILFELLTGKVPFNGDSLPALSINIVNEPKPPIRNLRPDLPPEFEPVLDRCLEKNRDRRYADVAELAAALLPFGSKRAADSVERINGIVHGEGRRPSVKATAIPSQDASSAQGSTGVSWGHTARANRKTRTWKALGFFGVFAALVLTALVWNTTRVPTQSAPAAPTVPAIVATAEAVRPVLSASDAIGVSPTAREPLHDAGLTDVVAPAASAPSEASKMKADITKRNGSGAASSAGAKSPPPKLDRNITFESPATAAGTKRNCTPPYTLDGDGRKHFKPECFDK